MSVSCNDISASNNEQIYVDSVKAFDLNVGVKTKPYYIYDINQWVLRNDPQNS